MVKEFRFPMKYKISYGHKKFWEWGMRSDLPVSSQAITAGTVYITPWNMDSLCAFKLTGVKGKWNYQVLDPFESSQWSISWYWGVYKYFRGWSGSAGTLKLLGQGSSSWSGIGSAGATTIYDASTATSITALPLKKIPDGALYLAQLWTVSSNSMVTAFILNKFGTTVTSGSYLYANSGSTGQTSFPQTIAAHAQTAKIDQEHWIGEN